jgi:acyl carrier protein
MRQNFQEAFFMTIDKIKQILADTLDVNVDELSADTNIATDLGADSLDVVEILMSIEDEFEIEIPDSEIENIRTIGELVEYIETNM